jgi:hypothetical protein
MMGNQIMYGTINFTPAKLKKKDEKNWYWEKEEKKVEEPRSTLDCLVESGEYALDRTLSNNGMDRNAYHGKCHIGPHIQKLLD